MVKRGGEASLLELYSNRYSYSYSYSTKGGDQQEAVAVGEVRRSEERSDELGMRNDFGRNESP